MSFAIYRLSRKLPHNGFYGAFSICGFKLTHYSDFVVVPVLNHVCRISTLILSDMQNRRIICDLRM